MSATAPSSSKRTSRLHSSRHEIERSGLLEQIYVHSVYEKLAEDFDRKYHQPWPEVIQFLRELSPGSLVADIGCGNGHYLNVNSDIIVLGIDRCQQLLQSAQNNITGLSARADCLAIPYSDGIFDAVLCVGVLHHLVSAKRQARALREMNRILRPGGCILLYVCAWEQPNRQFVGQNLLVPRIAPAKKILETTTSRSEVSRATAAEETLLTRLESMIITSKAALQGFLSRKNGKDDILVYDKSSNRRLCDKCVCLPELVEIPEEFKVREFPGSSLVSFAKPKNRPSAGTDQKRCLYHTLPSDMGSRDERFYHVFKKGEVEELIRRYVPYLSVVDTSYRSGQWCVTLAKLAQQS